MEADRFDSLTRRLTLRLSRRRSLRLLVRLGLAGLITPDAVTAKRKKNKKQCPLCKKRKKGKCKPKADGTVCGTDQVCSGGACIVPACGAGGPCRVFLSSTHYTGALGGLPGADAKCQGLATAAGLLGTYQAWLSDDTGSPSSRFVRSSGPYRLVTGTTIAANWTDLTDGTLLASILVTETGGRFEFPDDLAWTNTRIDGARDDATQQCANWSSNSALIYGRIGRARRDSYWTQAALGKCDHAFHLYCFQQS